MHNFPMFFKQKDFYIRNSKSANNVHMMSMQNSPMPLIHVNFIQKLNAKFVNHVKGIHREKAPSNKVPEETKSMNIDIGTSNQLFRRVLKVK